MKKEKMKILFITTFYPPNNTGASVVMSNLIKELDQDTLYGVVTWANSYKDKDETVNGKIVHKLFNFQYLFNSRLWFFVRNFTLNKEKRKVIKKRPKTKNLKPKKKKDINNSSQELIFKIKPEWVKSGLANKAQYQKKYNKKL